jgi:hypothetical protein
MHSLSIDGNTGWIQENLKSGSRGVIFEEEPNETIGSLVTNWVILVSHRPDWTSSMVAMQWTLLPLLLLQWSWLAQASVTATAQEKLNDTPTRTEVWGRIDACSG